MREREEQREGESENETQSFTAFVSLSPISRNKKKYRPYCFSLFQPAPDFSEMGRILLLHFTVYSPDLQLSAFRVGALARIRPFVDLGFSRNKVLAGGQCQLTSHIPVCKLFTSLINLRRMITTAQVLKLWEAIMDDVNPGMRIS